MIESFDAETLDIRAFLDSIKNNVVYVIPALIETFAEKYRVSNPKTLKDLMTCRSYINCLFVLVKDNTDWAYVGISLNGKPLCRSYNSDVVMELNDDEEIKWIF